MVTMEFVRTPDERFTELPDFPYEPHYIESPPGYPSLRMHYVDEGSAKTDAVFLCLHGEPTWSYLYRKMIPVFATHGRVIAPDFFGFGRSDKPVDDDIYTFSFHRGAIAALIEQLDLRRVTLVCQDWGGIVGLTLPLLFPDRFERLIVMNTALVTGAGTPSPGFVAWRDYVASRPDLDVGRVMKRSIPALSEREAAAYDAPFPDQRSKAGVRRFPAMVPLDKDMDGAAVSAEAAQWWRQQWRGPTFMAVGKQDPVLGPEVMATLRETIAGCPEPLILDDAGHFVQESGDVVAKAALEHFAKHSADAQTLR